MANGRIHSTQLWRTKKYYWTSLCYRIGSSVKNPLFIYTSCFSSFKLEHFEDLFILKHRVFYQKYFIQVPLSVTRVGRLTRVASTPDSEFEIRNMYGTPDYPIKPKPENLSRAKKVNRFRQFFCIII